MRYLNPHDVITTKQQVFWNDLEVGIPIELELVDYFKAPVCLKARGIYVAYYAVAKCEYNPLGIKPGDELFVYFSYKAFVGAISKLPVDKQVPCLRKYADGKNLLIKVEKINSKCIKIFYQKIVEPDGHLDSESQYEYLRRENEERYTRPVKNN